MPVQKRPASALESSEAGPSKRICSGCLTFNVSKRFGSLDALQDAVNRDGWGFLLIGSGHWRRVCFQELLKHEHLLLHVEIVDIACELAGTAEQLRMLSEQGNRKATKELQNRLADEARVAARLLSSDPPLAARESLSRVLGLAVFVVLGDGLAWLRKRTIAEIKRLHSMLGNASKAMNKALGHSDRSLGLAPVVGRPGGYRVAVQELCDDFLRELKAVMDRKVKKRPSGFRSHLPS
mmetsp:Transcript_133584/g.236385  ORF Transcript_133584/g.236385 Transcript_133584/m.236385 type:complete len:237 (-) Transcript_133584:111-821(-)